MLSCGLVTLQGTLTSHARSHLWPKYNAELAKRPDIYFKCPSKVEVSGLSSDASLAPYPVVNVCRLCLQINTFV